MSFFSWITYNLCELLYCKNGGKMMKSLLGLPIKPMYLKELNTCYRLDRVIVESLEQALYRVTMELNGQRYFLVDDTGKNLTKRSKLEILVLFKSIAIDELYLKHDSPYDEMIGLQEGDHDNELLVPLGNYYAHNPE